MAITARLLIRDALRKIRVVGKGATVPPHLQADAFRDLNYMMGRLNAIRLFKGVRVRSPYTLVDGTGSYTIGATGTLVGERPNEIESLAILQAGTTLETPLTLLSSQRWQGIRDKSLEGEPWGVRYEPTSPNGTLKFVYIPDRAAGIAIYHQQKVAGFATLDTTYYYEDGLEEVLMLNLALRIAPDYGKQLDPTSTAIATNGLADLKAKVEADSIPEMECDFAGNSEGSFNIYTGEIG